MAGRKATGREVKVIEPITPQQQTFIEALLAGKSISEAALVAGVSRRSATYWLHDGEHPVTVEYEKQATLHRQQFYDRVANIQSLALKAIEDALSEEAPPALRLKTAMFIFESQLQHLIPRARVPAQPVDLVEQELKIVGERHHITVFSGDKFAKVPD